MEEEEQDKKEESGNQPVNNVQSKTCLWITFNQAEADEPKLSILCL